MAYDEKLAGRVRKFLADVTDVEEKKMFRGLTFMVKGKMCVSVSGDELMCRFDRDLQDKVAEKDGFRPMIMKGILYKGYGYIASEVIRSKRDFEYWVHLALDFNARAKLSPKRKK